MLFCRRYLSDHGGETVGTNKTLAQDKCEFALALVNLVFVGIERAYALLEREQTLVDLRTVKLGLLAHVNHIRSLLTAGQVDEIHLGHHFVVRVGQFELEH